MTGEDLLKIQIYLKENCGKYDENPPEAFAKRMMDHSFTFDEHVKGMIYAMLSNRRPWKQIESHIRKIDKLFFDYDPKHIKEMNAEYFIKGIENLSCGNIDIEHQMKSLKHNIETMETLEYEYGTLDAYVFSKSPDKIVAELSDRDSDYKLERMGKALTYEYLRNVGVDACKPDTHLRRFLGGARMGSCNRETATEKETIEQVKQIAEEAGMKMYEVDQIIWNFCADGYGEVCTATPHCDRCVVKEKCRRNKSIYGHRE